MTHLLPFCVNLLLSREINVATLRAVGQNKIKTHTRRREESEKRARRPYG